MRTIVVERGASVSLTFRPVCREADLAFFAWIGLPLSEYLGVAAAVVTIDGALFVEVDPAAGVWLDDASGEVVRLVFPPAGL